MKCRLDAIFQNPCFEIIEIDPLRMQEPQLGAVPILKNTFVDKVKKILLAIGYALLDVSAREDNCFLRI